jgi:hypothetical protein
MSLVATVDGSALSNRIRLRGAGETGFGATSAADGTGSTGGVIFDDPDGDLSLQGWQTITIDETSCTDAPRIFTGFIGDRTYSRGRYSDGPAREIDCTIIDQNTLMSFALISNPDGKRPAETHIERIDWLLGSVYIPGGLISDLGLVDRSHPRPFPETDYRGQYPSEVLSDLAGPIFKIWYVYWDQDAEALGLFFDEATSVSNASTLSFSNDPSDWSAADGLSGTCLRVYTDGALAVDPSEVYSKARQVYRNGVVIENNDTTKTTFFGSLGHRGVEADNDRNGLESTARAQLQNILARDSKEAEVLTFTAQLSAAQVGLIDAGQRVGVRFTHLPGFETLPTYTRVERRITSHTEGRRDFYDVQLTCSTRGLTTIGGGGDPGVFPAPPGCSPVPTQVVPQEDLASSDTHVPISTPNAGDLLIGVIFGRGTITGPNGCTDDGTGTWTEHPDSPQTPAGGSSVILRAYEKISEGNETSIFLQSGGSGNKCQATVFVIPQATVEERIVSTGAGFGPPQPFDSGTLSQSRKLLIDGTVFNADDISHDYAGTVAGATEVDDGTVDDNFSPGFWIGYAADVASLSGSWNHNNGWASLTYGIDCDTSTNPPLSGQEVGPETVVMTGDSGTTAWPFADGSLRVYVDDTDQTTKITSADGATGDFTLAFTPTPTETVVVWYQGR